MLTVPSTLQRILLVHSGCSKGTLHRMRSFNIILDIILNIFLNRVLRTVCKFLRKMVEELRLWEVTVRCSSCISGSAWLPYPLCSILLPGIFLTTVSQLLLCSAFSNSFRKLTVDVSGAGRLSQGRQRCLYVLWMGFS